MEQNTRELLLLRHAKSDWKSTVASDFQRPLSKRGARDAPRVGQWLNGRGLRPDLVIGSPATRARRTACEACKAFGIRENHIDWEPRVYDAVPGTLLAVLGARSQSARRVLLVGHNPGLELLLIHLCGAGLGAYRAYGNRGEKVGNCGHFPARFEDNSELFDENLRETGTNLPLSEPIHPKSDRLLEQPSDGKLLPTATLARIAMPSDWRALQPGSGRLISLTRPAEMT